MENVCHTAILTSGIFSDPGSLEALPRQRGKGTTCKETRFKELGSGSAGHKETDGGSLVDLFLAWRQFVCQCQLALVTSCLACELVSFAGPGHG